MNPARWESAKRIFHEALERPPAAREAFVREAAVGDAELHDEAVALLTAQTKAAAAVGDVAQPASTGSASQALSPGRSLGPYLIAKRIGAGGMGEVYQARDARLDRTVAIKVLPALAAADPQARERFEREARAVSSLNHPHICTLHDIGHHEGIDYLVMEHLEGETLAARLTKGPLPIAQALQIGIQIASALDRAHRAGIVHRDLKPGNIFLIRGGGSAAPTAKLLDFGLAKACAPAIASAATRVALAPDLTTPGMILGTVQYMAPEQVEGQDADARSDIWALGAVLYEMTTGAPPFAGESAASVIAAILTKDPPPISARQPLSPQAFDHIVGRCLEKDPDERWQTAADLMRELRWAGASTSTGVALPPSARFGQRLSWVVAVAGVTAAVVMAVALARAPRGALVAAPVMRFEITPPPNATFAMNAPATVPTTQLALSPDGRWLAFVAERAGSEAMLWIRPIDGTAAQALPGTEDGSYPFWAPDSHAIGFFAQGKLKRIDVPGGAPQTLCDAVDPRGGSWSRNNVVLFGLNQTGLWRVLSSGGEPALATKSEANETGHRWPSFLPDGRHFLFFARGRLQGESSVNVGSIDSQERTRLFGSSSSASYASSGHLLSLVNGMLIAQPFDPVKRTLSGDPVTIAQDVAGSSVNYSSFSTSDTGLLAVAAPTGLLMQLAWFGREGKVIARLGQPRDYADVQLSPDDRRALLTRLDARTGAGNIWTVDVATGASSPLTFDPSVAAQPVWSPDGREVVFRSNREIPAPLFRRLASGAGGDELLLRSEKTLAEAGNMFPSDWSSDGRFVLFHAAFPGTGYDVWVLPMTGDRTPRPFVRSRVADMHARFSHDGRFVAYMSAESGHPQIYVQPFPAADGRWQLSTDGGSEPRWRADGRELYFIGADRRLMAVPIAAGASFEHGAPVPLFTTRVSNFANPFRTSYAVSGDGQRFLINGMADDAAVSSITAVANWPTLLKK